MKGQQLREKRLSIASHQGDTSQPTGRGPLVVFVDKTRDRVLLRVRRKGNLCALLVEMQTGAATLENSTEIPQK